MKELFKKKLLNDRSGYWKAEPFLPIKRRQKSLKMTCSECITPPTYGNVGVFTSTSFDTILLAAAAQKSRIPASRRAFRGSPPKILL